MPKCFVAYFLKSLMSYIYKYGIKIEVIDPLILVRGTKLIKKVDNLYFLEVFFQKKLIFLASSC